MARREKPKQKKETGRAGFAPSGRRVYFNLGFTKRGKMSI
jgi:hypothetical protein